MADFFSIDNSSLLDALAQDQSAQRSDLAQYAILKAGAFMKEGRNDEALDAFRQALAFDPENATALTYTGNINLSLGRTAEAIKAFKGLVKLQPTSVDAQMKLGNAYLQAKQYDESEKIYERAAKLDRLNPLPVYTLGLQYLNTGRLDEAEDKLQQSLNLAPGDGNVYYGFGMLYNKQEKYEDAARSLISAIQLKPNFPAARYELGVAFSKLGMTEQANEQLAALTSERSAYARDLNFILDRPRMTSITVASDSNFNLSLGAQSQLWTFDASFLTPDTSKVISVNIQFDNNMDATSVTNLSNWNISRAKGGVAGYYNNTVPTGASEVNIPSTPLSVTYNAYTGEARVSFLVSQNSDSSATLDPGHLVFKFTGVDSDGRSMDGDHDEIDGASDGAF